MSASWLACWSTSSVTTCRYNRQHQRLAMSGITLSRSTLTNLVERAVALLKPVYDAQLEHILLSKVLAMD